MVKTILFLSSNPTNTNRFRFDEEVREIEEGLRMSKNRDYFLFEKVFAASHRSVRRALLNIKPNIVHFSGHGSEKDGIVLEDQLGHAKFVDSKGFSNLFKLFSDTIECVILNACYSESQAESIVEYVDYAFGMSSSISEKAAIEFAIGIYDAIGAGRSIEFSYEYACNAVELHMPEVSDYLVPVLKKKSNSGNELVDLSELRKLLERKEWKKADLETRDLLIQLATVVSGKEQLSNGIVKNLVTLKMGGDIPSEIIRSLPCDQLKKIDKLWTNASNNRFGFSPQVEIFRNVGRNDLDWALKVGWRVYDNPVFEFIRKEVTNRSLLGWIPYDSLQFSLDAPKGHLPSLGKNGYGSDGSVRLIHILEEKLLSCQA